MVKKLRYYARFIVVCLLLKKMKLVRDLVRELAKHIDEYTATYEPEDQVFFHNLGTHVCSRVGKSCFGIFIRVMSFRDFNALVSFLVFALHHRPHPGKTSADTRVGTIQNLLNFFGRLLTPSLKMTPFNQRNLTV
jgi:hypothetical protein